MKARKLILGGMNYEVLLLIGCVNIPTFLLAVTPTPTCNPTGVSVKWREDRLKETFIPGEILTFELVPRYLDDWPTSPVFTWGDSISPPGHYDGPNPNTFTIPVDNPPETFRVRASAIGPGVDGCSGWNSNTMIHDMRRFDVTPTPTPSPPPTPSRTPVCTYTPNEVCQARLVLDPPSVNSYIADTFELEVVPPAAYLGTETFAGAPVAAEQVSENRWRHVNLSPGEYLIYFRCDYIPCLDNYPYVWARIIRVREKSDMWILTGDSLTTKSVRVLHPETMATPPPPEPAFPVPVEALSEELRAKVSLGEEKP
jgi:hypothetical protein